MSTFQSEVEQILTEVIDLVYLKMKPGFVDYKNKTHKFGMYKEQVKSLFHIALREKGYENPMLARELINNALANGGSTSVTIVEPEQEPVHLTINVEETKYEEENKGGAPEGELPTGTGLPETKEGR